jgi:hypothetical protein
MLTIIYSHLPPTHHLALETAHHTVNTIMPRRGLRSDQSLNQNKEAMIN